MKKIALRVLGSLRRSWMSGLALGAGVAVVLFLVWFLSGLRAANGEPTRFSIPAGQSRITIGQRLEEAGIIRSWVHFVLLSYMQRSVLLAGDFELMPTRSLGSILATLSSEKDRYQVVTIPEGWRREQIADYLVERGVDKAFFLAQTAELEGRLFPDTYYISVEPKVEDVIAKFTTNFSAKTAGLNVTTQDIILASIVEREAKRDEERALIAGIYANRIARGMKLDADPTVQYGRDTNLIKAGTPPQTYWGAITLTDYQGVQSAYNTYLRTGLPPSAIANPGLKSLVAAQSPQKTDALYFFHTSKGDIITSTSLSEHNLNKRKYLN